jgi:peptidyl-prolyl cis-trans isomerase SurA
MPHYKLILFFVSFSLLISCKPARVVSTVPTEVKEQPIENVILTIGHEDLTSSDLKPLITNYLVSDSLKYEELISEILFQKRLYLAAKEKGYSADSSILGEADSYLGILAESYIQDTIVLNNLSKLTYERMNKELNASHILLPISLFASPSDTLLAYRQILKIKADLDSGSSFDSLAALYSGDINTKNNGGNMGWFSALQFLYSLEDAAYKTAIGEVSSPIRTKAGYHLIKVNASRDFSGNITVKHILKAVPKSSSAEFIEFQKVIIDSIYNELIQGAAFDELCLRVSDDSYTSPNGGLLAPFTVGSRQEVAFEVAAFSLKLNEISKPVKTEIGWHIIKLIDKKLLGSYAELSENILSKITTDSRGEYIKNRSIEKYLPLLKVYENKNLIESLFGLGNSTIAKRTWKFDLSKTNDDEILNISGKSYSSHDFLRIAKEKQSFEKLYDNFTPDMYLRKYYHDYKNELILKSIIEHLPEWNEDFKNVSTMYKEGLVTSQYLNDVIYTRSISDTTGQKTYFRSHQEEFQLPAKAKAQIIKANSKETIQKYIEIVDGEIPYRLKRGIRPIYYTKNSSNLDDEIKTKLIGLTVILANNPGYIVEVGGHNDINEEISVSLARVKTIVNFLIANGVEITRIREYDYGTSKLADRFDWTQNQRTSFQFFTIDKNDVIRALNEPENPIMLTEGLFIKGQNELIDGTNWEKGKYEAQSNGSFYRIEINEVQPARNKTYQESYGAVLFGYQKELEKQLKAELNVKYPSIIKSEELKKLYTIYKQKNL